MGTARWLIIKSKSQKATYHSRSVVFLVVFCFLYPFYSLAIDSNIGGLIGNIATILLAGWTAYQIKSSSKAASAFMFPVVLWVSFATAIIIRLLQRERVNQTRTQGGLYVVNGQNWALDV
jgi:tryptophan-rich sensory protein